MNLNPRFRIVVAASHFGTDAIGHLINKHHCQGPIRKELDKRGVEIDHIYHDKKWSKRDLMYYCKHADGIIAGSEVYDADVLAHCNNLKVISRIGVGIDNIDMEVCERRGIIVCNTPEAPTQAVAEFTVGQMLSLIRSTHIYKKRKDWNPRIVGKQLSEMRIGILGYGRIGQAVHNILKPFGCFFNIYDKDPDMILAPFNALKHVESLFENSDIVTIHIPMEKWNKNFVNSRLLDLIPKGSYLINTSRGGIVDENHLYKLLKSGKLAGAAIDVFETEPYKGPLQYLDNVLCTPHVAWATAKAKKAMEEGALDNCFEVLSKLG